MTTATKHFHKRIALVFDFDQTLAPDSVDALLSSMGFDPEKFRNERFQPLMDAGWEDTLAKIYCIIQESKARELPVTRDFLLEVGQKLELYPGLEQMFDRIRNIVRSLIEDVDVEFYVLTCGFIEIPRGMSVSDQFNGMWGSEFYYNEKGEIEFVKQLITFPEKVHYLLALSKGTGMGGPNEPADAYRPVDEEELYVPVNQIIYVGDGGSDMPSFQLMNDNGGIAIGVFKGDKNEWPGYKNMRRERRVENLAPADFREGSELMDSIQLAVESICKRMLLRRLGKGE